MSENLNWHTSSYSSGSGPSECVEVATTDAVAHVRDSKERDRGAFAVSGEAWSRFLGAFTTAG